ncbi:uncharacterized protein LOC131608180 [Vicia villosa]|uniref:uncharacterized protein LOC131608180 n=1 Tax=Vicia villosa TaxID=3911 RepID=UPI00273B1BBE|nr:uncharacterized protein LOC131608180 [Vicia villosa]
MEIEARKGVVAKKLWKMVRVLFFMITKGIAKIHLNLILKRGKLAGKDFINTLIMNRQLYYSSFTCRSCGNGNSFISPLEFEFSCSNTPLHHSSRRFSRPRQRYGDVFIMNNNNDMMLNNEKVEAVKNSSLDTFPGFGKNPVGRQLRVTDSPFLVQDKGDSNQVDMAAEEFINNFYKQLNRQNRSIATYES